MRRRAVKYVLITFAIVWTVGASAAKAQVTRPCLAASPEIFAHEQEAEAYTHQSFDNALAARALKTIVVSSHLVAPGLQRNYHPPGETFIVDEAGEQRIKIAGPFLEIPTRQQPAPAFEFAGDALAHAWRVQRQPNVESSEAYLLCGCGPIGGGAAPWLMQLIYDLDKDATYQGELAVAYAARIVRIEWDEMLASGLPCPRPS